MITKRIYMLIAVFCMLPLAACTNGSDKPSASEEVQVEIRTVQNPIQSERATLIEAHVTQGNAPVQDAREVKFEIWKEDQQKHEQIVATHWQNGVYRIKKMFPNDGNYQVIAHVTAGDAQVKPQKELVVGNVPAK
ncbi:FixH family protein [Paenibacillus sp. MBLB4367]|uniref:FixH family protein n=1 Tax=Paenibacillus sp. MBLB4367 TaxID=3384767 RepID=UPI00390830C7